MPIIEARGIGKTYGAVVALDGVSLAVEPGSVHALLGENGAGKSTLVKIMSGAVAPSSGELWLDGERARFRSTAEAARRGAAIVSQELNLFGDLDVLANLFPKREIRRGPFVSRAAMARAAAPVLAELGLDISLRTQVGRLSLAQRQLIEIGRALLTKPRVLILDEPTSALDKTGTDRLLNILAVLRERDVGVVFVSHILEDVMALSDVITVLRDGRSVLTAEPAARLSVPALVEAMLGDKAAGALRTAARTRQRPGHQSNGAGALEFAGVSVPDRLTDVSLSVAAGEVVGLAGLVGAGQATVLELAAGLVKPAAGKISLPSGRQLPLSFASCIEAGVALVSGDRRGVGLMLDKPIWENVAQVRTVALGRDGLLARRGAMRRRAQAQASRLRLKYASLDQRAALLSGGNQQKVVFAKWLEVSPAVLLLDDPTRGVDVAARAEMHALIGEVAQSGAAVLLCSTDLDELAAVCDRVHVFFRGEIAGTLSGDALTEHGLLEAMNVSPAPSRRF